MSVFEGKYEQLFPIAEVVVVPLLTKKRQKVEQRVIEDPFN